MDSRLKYIDDIDDSEYSAPTETIVIVILCGHNCSRFREKGMPCVTLVIIHQVDSSLELPRLRNPQANRPQPVTYGKPPEPKPGKYGRSHRQAVDIVPINPIE